MHGCYYFVGVGESESVGLFLLLVAGNELSQHFNVFWGVMNVEGGDVHFSEAAGNELGEVRSEMGLGGEEVEGGGVEGGFEAVGEDDVFCELVVGVCSSLLGGGGEGQTDVVLVEFVFEAGH